MILVSIISFAAGAIVMIAVIALMRSGHQKDLENEIIYLKTDIFSLKDENAHVKELRDKLLSKVAIAYNDGFSAGKLSLVKQLGKSMIEDHEQNILPFNHNSEEKGEHKKPRVTAGLQFDKY